jgi:tetratricopeptide (TPR) repeat protein
MQEGIKFYKEGRQDDAYRIFTQLTKGDPSNEFAWIWLSVTSGDVAEKRNALERALEINPNSSHAKDAMRELEMRTKVEEANPYTAIPPLPSSAPVNIPPYSGNDDPLANLRSGSKGKNGKSKKVTATPTKTGKAKAQQRITGTARRIRLAIFMALLAIVALLLVYFVANRNNANNQTVGDVNVTPTAEVTATTTADTTSASTTAVQTSAVATTAAISTTSATSTTAAQTSAVATTPAATATTVVQGNSNTSSNTGEKIDKLLQAGRQSAATGDYKTAINSINEALTFDPRNVAANLELGMTYLRAPDDATAGVKSRFDEAIRAFTKVTEQAPTWAAGWARLGEAQTAKGDVPNAIKSYTKSLELDSNGAERWLALADLYERNNQTAEATYARQRAQGLSATPPPGAPK